MPNGEVIPDLDGEEQERFWDMALSHVFGGEGESRADVVEVPEDLRCGRYRVLDEIARGGIGVVYLARDEDLRRDVAIKLLRHRYAQNESMIQRFLGEAQICGQLQHPGIVPVYEVGLSNVGRPFFSMKLVEGRNFAQLLADRQEPREERGRFLGIFEQICQTLAFAHDRGVIHRDLKPSNVMVGAFGEVQVVDWGFAKILSARSRLAGESDEVRPLEMVGSQDGDGQGSQAGAVLGTPLYMPPEQARGNASTLDARADVFALGAILCEILTGCPPYRSNGVNPLAQAAEASLEDAKARLLACAADEDLVHLALRCLEPEREDRPRNAGVVSSAIESYLAGIERRNHAVQMEAAEARGRAEQQSRSHRLAVAVTMLILVSVILGGSIVFTFDVAARQRRERTARLARKELDSVVLLMEAKDYSRADEALARARRIVERGPANADVAGEVADLSQRLTAAEAAARSAERSAGLRVKFAERLLELRCAADQPASSDAYGALYLGRGLLLGESPDVFIRTTASLEPTFVAELVRGLDCWALSEWATEGDSAARLFEITQRLDSNPDRNRLRKRLAGSGPRSFPFEAVPAAAREGGAFGVFLWARALTLAGMSERAFQTLVTAHDRFPADADINRELALIYGGWLQVGTYGVAVIPSAHPAHDRALPHLEQVVAVRENDLLAREHLAALLETANPDRAERVLDQVVLLAPARTRARFQRARVRLRRGMREEARLEVAKILELDPREAKVNEVLAQLESVITRSTR